jgi:hypothetical protein
MRCDIKPDRIKKPVRSFLKQQNIHFSGIPLP